ncbi:MAG: PilZ domain-containing protein [Thermodesulfobacteriota bacterium]|nr:PilZ domain-containing protein [Thermodesulfobacteriota bacterium]
MKTSNAMKQNIFDNRNEFRFPVVVPVEYFNNDDFGIISYAIDLSRNGTFISSDDPLGIGHHLSMNLTIPVSNNSSEILRAEGDIVWQRVQPFKSSRNGMGIHFSDPLSEALLLNTLSSNVRRLARESEAKKQLDKRVAELESELEDAERWAVIGRCTEKILFDISNPLTAMSGHLELIRDRMEKQIGVIAEKCKGNGLKNVTMDYEMCINDINSMLKDYASISELIRITGDDRKDLEEKLKEYRC